MQLHQTLLSDTLKTLDKYNEEVQITKGVDSLQTEVSKLSFQL